MRFGMIDTSKLPPCRQKQFGHTVYIPEYDPNRYKTSYTDRMAQLLLPYIENHKHLAREVEIAMKYNGKTHQEAKILIAESFLSDYFFYHYNIY